MNEHNDNIKEEVEELRQRLLDLELMEIRRQLAEGRYAHTSNELEQRLYERTSELWKVRPASQERSEMPTSGAKRDSRQLRSDPLTGLPNRMELKERINAALMQAEKEQGHIALLFLDLDRFKAITDSFGHSAGDRFLQDVAGRLKSILRKSDTAARLGGDEFALLLTGISVTEDVERIARKIQTCLQQPLVHEGHEVRISASIGISMYPMDGTEPDVLMKNADVAMYQAKKLGRNNFQFFAPLMNEAAYDRMMLEIGLRHALEREELVMYYQPQVNMDTWQIVGVEALVRWQHPELGIIQPNEFIPLAEETGLIIPIGNWVLRSVCKQIKSWQEKGFPLCRVTVNISARQFQQEDFVEMVTAELEVAGIEPWLIELEITESVAMENIEGTIEKIRKLSDLGISFSIDDFGTGYSSLSYLKKLPIRTLKIDKSFVQDVTTNDDGATIVSAVIYMAHSLNLKVIAEGVENREQLDFLISKKCNEMQGYLFSRPLTAWSFEQMITGTPDYAEKFRTKNFPQLRLALTGTC